MYVCIFFRISSDSPYLLEEPILKTIAKKHSRTPGQVALRYQLQRGVVVLAKSFNEKRIKENFEVKAPETFFQNETWGAISLTWEHLLFICSHALLPPPPLV